MPDPLQLLPNELWSLCLELAIDGRLNGPLDFLMVSTRWERLLLSSPSLWTQIYIQNGEDEMARISTFLQLSKRSPLHVDVMTVLPSVDSLQLVAEHISRIRTISIRPGASDNVTALHAKQWKLTASYVLAILSNGMHLSDVESPSCFGVSLWDHDQSYYHVILMQFAVTTTVASTDEQNRVWETRIAKSIPASTDQGFNTRTASISSIAELASRAQFQDVIRIAIPSFIKIFRDKERKVREEIIELLWELANRVEFREAIATTIQSLINLPGGNGYYAGVEITVLIGALANLVEFRAAIVSTIPQLIKLLQDVDSLVRLQAFNLVGKLANYVEFREAIATTTLPLIKLLAHDHPAVRLETIHLIGLLAYHGEFREAVATTIPSLVELLEYVVEKVRLDADRLIQRLKNHGYTLASFPVKALPAGFVSMPSQPDPLSALEKVATGAGLLKRIASDAERSLLIIAPWYEAETDHPQMQLIIRNIVDHCTVYIQAIHTSIKTAQDGYSISSDVVDLCDFLLDLDMEPRELQFCIKDMQIKAREAHQDCTGTMNKFNAVQTGLIEMLEAMPKEAMVAQEGDKGSLLCGVISSGVKAAIPIGRQQPMSFERSYSS